MTIISAYLIKKAKDIFESSEIGVYIKSPVVGDIVHGTMRIDLDTLKKLELIKLTTKEEALKAAMLH